jgi:hypothetical protein
MLWLDYRNFLRQAISNFRVALNVENRSASLLYYYAMLNFAKAELLAVQPAAVRGYIRHGLQFSVTKAKTVEGDYLTVADGVFPMLYERRTGYAIAVGTRLPVKRLLSHIPEIGEQVRTLGVSTADVTGLLQLIAHNGAEAWAVLALMSDLHVDGETASARHFRRFFRKVDAPPNWKERFGISRRWLSMQFYESIATFPFAPSDDLSMNAAMKQAADNTWSIHELLGLTTSGMCDAWLSPSLYKSKLLPMPPALARYSLAFYASSLVRYRPSMFDLQVFPKQAYLFDAIARECAVPMLLDTFSALTGVDNIFISEDGLRL